MRVTKAWKIELVVISTTMYRGTGDRGSVALCGEGQSWDRGRLPLQHGDIGVLGTRCSVLLYSGSGHAGQPVTAESCLYNPYCVSG